MRYRYPLDSHDARRYDGRVANELNKSVRDTNDPHRRARASGDAETVQSVDRALAIVELLLRAERASDGARGGCRHRYQPHHGSSPAGVSPSPRLDRASCGVGGVPSRLALSRSGACIAGWAGFRRRGQTDDGAAVSALSRDGPPRRPRQPRRAPHRKGRQSGDRRRLVARRDPRGAARDRSGQGVARLRAGRGAGGLHRACAEAFLALISLRSRGISHRDRAGAAGGDTASTMASHHPVCAAWPWRSVA